MDTQEFTDFDYADRVHRYLLKLQYGARISLHQLNEPERFRQAVIYLIDFLAISTNEYEFNGDYTVLKKIRPVELNRKTKEIDRGIYK